MEQPSAAFGAEQQEELEVAWAKSEEAKAAASGGLRAAPLKFTFSIIHTIGRNLIFGLKI